MSPSRIKSHCTGSVGQDEFTLSSNAAAFMCRAGLAIVAASAAVSHAPKKTRKDRITEVAKRCILRLRFCDALLSALALGTCSFRSGQAPVIVVTNTLRALQKASGMLQVR